MSKAHAHDGEKEVGEHEQVLSLNEQAQTAETNDMSNYIYQISNSRQNYRHEKLSTKYY